jgi:hypothetical protein
MAIRSGNSQGFLTRLRRDEAGNTLAIVAAAIFPMLGLIGGGIDMSRVYLVKARLQQACDAGALAGRKAMGNGSWTTGTSSSSEGRATAMFNGNFVTGDYGSGTLTKSFSESGGVVTGAASAPVPMTIMKVFGFTSKTISVTCTAKMEIPNTDVMFVIDNTGSMNCQVAHSGYTCPGGDNNGVEDASAKMKGLRSAIKCFYEALARIDTTENCGSTP